jgi:hypothetical protein
MVQILKQLISQSAFCRKSNTVVDGEAEILFRAAAAALLNAYVFTSGDGPPYTVEELIALVDAALNPNGNGDGVRRQEMLTLATWLDDNNNALCQP